MQAKGSKPNAAHALCKIIQKNPHRYEWRAYSSDNGDDSDDSSFYSNQGDSFTLNETIPGEKSFIEGNSPEIFSYSQVSTRGHGHRWQNAFGFLPWTGASYKNVELESKSDSTVSL
jgi:hypothetical protein